MRKSSVHFWLFEEMEEIKCAISRELYVWISSLATDVWIAELFSYIPVCMLKEKFEEIINCLCVYIFES